MTEKKLFPTEIDKYGERSKYFERLDETTKSLLLEDAEYFIHQNASTPCIDVVASGKGVYIETLSGKKIMDFHGNNVHQVGYGNEFIIERVKKQLDELAFSPRRFTNSVAIEYSRKLTGLAPGNLKKVLFTPGGSSSTGLAIKLARLITGKHKVISMWDSFHGNSIDAISVGGSANLRSGSGPLLPGVEHVPYPGTYEPWNNHTVEFFDKAYADYIDYVVQKEVDVSAIIIESIRNSIVRMPSVHFWKRLRETCDKNGIILIVDEIPSCLGRTGKLFVIEHFGIVPDMLLLGKGLAGGILPFSAVLINKEFDTVAEKSVGHYTFEKSPLACAAALATLEYIENENLLARAIDTGNYFNKRISLLKTKHPKITEVRGIGVLQAIELSPEIKTTGVATKIMYECIDKGVNFTVSQGHIISLSTPLIITPREIDFAVSVIDEALTNFL